MTRRKAFFTSLALAALFATTPVLHAQEVRPPSPRGTASTQLGGAFVEGTGYRGGYWIDVSYGRPILRDRHGIFGSGDSYGKGLLLGAPLWRIGADQSTRFRTEVDLIWEGGTLPAGEYSIFAETGATGWTLIFTNWGVKESYPEETADALWGAYGYTPANDVLRTPMRLTTTPISADQLVVVFTDVTRSSGNLTVWWDDQMATAPFSIAP
ncbi:MAG: DUF2911 domain-containing protein [Gemmatimonadota bacterium]|jgi:hypothetical protein|nr:DUF2911 domain-containing protein [Gemmatimonadota bacterium]